MKNGIYALILSATALATTMPVAATAQSRTKLDEKRQFDIAAGELVTALEAWTRITRRELVYRSIDVESRSTNGVTGEMAPVTALMTLLEGTGLQAVTSPDGAIAIRPIANADVGSNATPEILVAAKTGWSLNTGIERTQDDSQPFIVMTRKEIERSGAPDLETFLRNQLNVNTSPVVGQQANARPNTVGTRVGASAINLRGVGLRDTLILIDGRRQPGVNVGGGDISQASITGIPIAAIERIEVLASSASGIYGSGASGGVINIILRRDFNGGELAMNYSDTTDFAQGEGRIDLTAGMPLEGGRTRVSLTANWTKSDPLRYGDRYSLAQRGLSKVLANNPDYFEGSYSQPPNGSAVNFNSMSGEPLVLKPEYGGTTLGSRIGSIPAGYRGLQVDGIAPLLAGIGSYNLDQPDSASGTGTRAPLLYGTNQYRGSLAVRREFSKAVTAYAEIGASRSATTTNYANTIDSFYLDADAPNNPFTDQIVVAMPASGADVSIKSTTSTFRTLGGVIAALPWDWQAVAEVSYSTSKYKTGDRPPETSSLPDVQMGGIDALRDVSAYPLNLLYDSVPYGNYMQAGRASVLAPSLRVAGKLPLKLPGGQPQLTLNGEISSERTNSVFCVTRTDLTTNVTFVPAARQTTKSLYGEIAFPIFGESNNIPLIRMLEFRVSARHESYVGNGADPFSCIGAGGSEADSLIADCPPAGTAIPRSKSRNSHTDPSVSLLWAPVNGIALRGSYTTGYLPPSLAQLARTPATLSIYVRDPERGNELIGVNSPSGAIAGFVGGNPAVRPESSKTLTAGVILTPAFVPGLRFSVDWTRLRKKDLYYDPIYLAFPVGETQASFDDFLARNPDRITRGPASDGFAVGPITSLDLSMVNLNALKTDAFDFTFNYDTLLFGGELSLTGRATYVDSLAIQAFADLPEVDYAGIVSYEFATSGGGSGALRWRGNVSAQWSRDALSLGWQARYLDGYYLDSSKTINPNQGSARVASQTYHDINLTYRFPFNATLRFGINNILNKKPPFDATSQPLYYSPYGDPRLRNFYLGITKSF